MAKRNRSKSRKVHCALCHFGQTEYGCNLCKVTLCKAAEINSQHETSCFVLWHKHKDLLAIKNTLQEERRKHKQAGSNKGNDATSGSNSGEESKSRHPQRKGRTRRIVPAGRIIVETEQNVEEKRNESVEKISSEETNEESETDETDSTVTD